MSRKTVAAILGTLLVSGCALKQKEVMHTVDNPAPVNCATAEGVTSLTPAGAALGILTLTETTKWKVAVGEYNKMIDKRMAQIKAECGL
jgi:hypothetical protein